MANHVLRLTRDDLHAGALPRPLPGRNRVFYVLSGALLVGKGPAAAQVAEGAAHFSAGATELAPGPDGAASLRCELVRADAPDQAAGAVLLEHPIDLAADQEYLMRCDRVDFDPAGVALPHRHKGGGIRYLLRGSMDLRIEGHPDRAVRPGEAWFESGREPVYAAGATDKPTSFIRVSILPRAIKGQSSIMYVDPEDAVRSRPRTYTVFVDEPITLP